MTATVEKIQSQADYQPDQKPRPVCPTQLRHQISAGHQPQNRNQVEFLNETEHNHNYRDRNKYQQRDLLAEDIPFRMEIKELFQAIAIKHNQQNPNHDEY